MKTQRADVILISEDDRDYLERASELLRDLARVYESGVDVIKLQEQGYDAADVYYLSGRVAGLSGRVPVGR